MLENKEPLTADDLNKRQAELDKYRQDLLKVQETLKPQAEIFNLLKDKGINDVNDLQVALTPTNSPATPPKEDEKTSMPTLGDNSEVEDLKKQVEQLNQTVQNQNYQIRTDRLMSEIKANISGNSEYQLLEKGLNENIAYNLLRQIEKDKSDGFTRDLEHYLKPAEKELRSFYEKLGGKIEEKKSDGGGAGESTLFPKPPANQEENKASNDGTISFPTLPSHGSGDSSGDNKSMRDKILDLGKNPRRPQDFDSDRAFNALVQEAESSGNL